jgi:HAD superfamily hydrolase (TIGR01509 family)
MDGMKALIFDFDGLILDTETSDYQSWQQIYHSYGQELSLPLWLTFVGGTAATDFDPYDHLETLLGEEVDREQIWINRRKIDLEALAGLPPMPGVVDLLAAAQARGLKLAVASSSPASWVEGHLAGLGLLEYFEEIVTSDDVEKTKPDPALFLLAAEKLGVQPGEVIVLEDSYNGVTGAKKAGMFVVAVPNPITRASDLSAADLQLNSLADTSLEELLKIAESKHE